MASVTVLQIYNKCYTQPLFKVPRIRCARCVASITWRKQHQIECSSAVFWWKNEARTQKKRREDDAKKRNVLETEWDYGVKSDWLVDAFLVFASCIFFISLFLSFRSSFCVRIKASIKYTLETYISYKRNAYIMLHMGKEMHHSKEP